MKNKWPIMKLGDVCEINPTRKPYTYDDNDEVSFVPMTAVSEITKRIEVKHVRKFSEVKKGYTAFKNGDIIFDRCFCLNTHLGHLR